MGAYGEHVRFSAVCFNGRCSARYRFSAKWGCQAATEHGNSVHHNGKKVPTALSLSACDAMYGAEMRRGGTSASARSSRGRRWRDPGTSNRNRVTLGSQPSTHRLKTPNFSLCFDPNSASLKPPQKVALVQNSDGRTSALW
eukprot:2457054-Rhodomonas_salina.1